jgi:hypothetical protein
MEAETLIAFRNGVKIIIKGYIQKNQMKELHTYLNTVSQEVSTSRQSEAYLMVLEGAIQQVAPQELKKWKQLLMLGDRI